MPPQPPPSPEPRPGQGQPTSGPGEVTTPPRERVGLGLLAAIVAVVGGVVVTVVVAQLGFIAAISSFVIAFGATFLYEAAAGRPARRGLVPLVVLIVLGVALSYAALLASDLWDAYAELGLTDPSRTTFVLDHVMSKWSPLVLASLSDGEPLRWSELRRRAEGVSEKMLAQTLRTLEQDGLVLRVARPVVPPHVEYSLTPLGGGLVERLVPLMTWIAQHADAILDQRDAEHA